jgi:uncharacterized membrane protein
VKAIENARVINQQTLVQAGNGHNKALHEIAVVTNEFNDAQVREREREREIVIVVVKFVVVCSVVISINSTASIVSCTLTCLV